MAISMGSEEDAPMSEINTTPLVDVMLVLLIIFLITVPVVIQTVPVELPKVANIVMTTSNTAPTPNFQRLNGYTSFKN